MGRPSKLFEQGLRVLKKHVLENCFEPLYAITAPFNHHTQLYLSTWIIRRFIKKMNFSPYIAVQKPFLCKKKMKAQIEWARTHDSSSMQQWANVSFTDVATFTVRPIKNRLKVWRYRGSRMHQRHIVPTFKSGYQTVSVWGAFSVRGRTSLVGTTAISDRNTYHILIDNHILPFVNDLHGGTDRFVLQEDNCGPHRALSIDTCLENIELKQMQWHARSPDLSPIENIWGLLKGRLRNRHEHPSSPMQLFSFSMSYGIHYLRNI